MIEIIEAWRTAPDLDSFVMMVTILGAWEWLKLLAIELAEWMGWL